MQFQHADVSQKDLDDCLERSKNALSNLKTKISHTIRRNWQLPERKDVYGLQKYFY